MTTPKELAVAALVVLGALTAIRELLGELDRLRFASDTQSEIDDLPSTDAPADAHEREE